MRSRQPFLIPPAALLLLATLPAQRVTPTAFATTHGNASFNAPFGSALWAYQQIVTDLGAPMVVTRMAFRQAGSGATIVARTVVCSLEIGPSSFAARTATFAANFTQPPTTAFTAKTINLPAYTSAPPGGYPGPFDCIFPFDTPWPFLGAQDMAFLLRVTSNTATSSSYANSGHYYPDSNFGSSFVTGTGCLSTGQTQNHTLSGTIRTFYNGVTTLQWSGNYATLSSPTAVLLSAAGANQSLPGLCAPLFVDASQIFLVINGTSSATTGSYSTPLISAPYLPSAVGVSIHAQGAALDAGQSGIPVSLTRGTRNTVPTQPPAPFPICFLAATNPNATGAGITNGWGLIVQWN